MKLRTKEDVKRLLAGRIGKPIREDIWTEPSIESYVEEFLEFKTEDTWRDLLNEYRRLDAKFPLTGRAQRQKTIREIPPDRRLEVLSYIIAAEASRLPEVRNFREKVLRGRLLAPEDVPSWIEQHKAEATIYVRIPLPSKPQNFPDWFSSLAAIPEEERATWPVEYQSDTLAYPVPGEEFVRRVPVDKNSPLGHLKQVVTKLVTRSPWWQEAQAVAFVLTGVVPPLPRARITITYSSHMPPRITLEVDPRLSSREVADIYAKARSEVFQGRDKPMGEKHLTLAAFLAENATGETWQELMGKWNREYPKWKYTDYRWFCRDARAAFKRVTGRDWTPPTKVEHF